MADARQDPEDGWIDADGLDRRVLAAIEVEKHGLEAAAEVFEVSVRTIRRWRAKVASDPELRRKRVELIEQELADRRAPLAGTTARLCNLLVEASVVSIEKAKAADGYTPGVIREVAGALKIASTALTEAEEQRREQRLEDALEAVAQARRAQGAGAPDALH